MPIEQVERSYFHPLIKDRVKQLKLGDKGPLTLFGGIEVVSDDTIRVKGNKLLLLPGRTLKGEEINKPDGVGEDPFHFFPPRSIGYRYKPSDQK